MKRKKRRILSAVFVVFLIFCLLNLKQNWKLASYKSQVYDFLITNEYSAESNSVIQGISPVQAKDILEQNAESEDIIPVAFYKVLEEQILENPDLGRSFRSKVYKTKGDSSLLFPDEFPLQDDERGCLISEGLAWELFGDLQVVGASVWYGDRECIVRGILATDDMIFVHSTEDENDTLDGLVLAAENYRTKELYAQHMQFYGLMLKERPSFFQHYHITADRLPNRMSDFQEWERFFEDLFK